jgi:predicted transcriptional regulator
MPSSLIVKARITPVTPTQSIHHRGLIYGAAYDALQRDPVVDPAQQNRATVPLGRGFALWQRMNAGAQLVWIDDAEGTPRALTPRQAKVLALALEMIEGTGMTMRAMATALNVAPSTVSRALTKLAAWGLIAYIVGRGRWAGLVIFRRAKDDGFDRLRQAAKARVRRWSQYAQDRISRLEFNVASYFLGRESSPTRDYYLTTKYMDATLTAQRSWTPEELRDAGII